MASIHWAWFVAVGAAVTIASLFLGLWFFLAFGIGFLFWGIIKRAKRKPANHCMRCGAYVLPHHHYCARCGSRTRAASHIPLQRQQQLRSR